MIRKIPVGKKVIDAIYFHKDYLSDMIYRLNLVPEEVYEKARTKCMASFYNYTILKYDKRKGTFTFICCPFFDDHFEPAIEYTLTYNSFTDKVTRRNYFKGSVDNNPPIYHHKWLMVDDDYSRCNVQRSKMRSILIEKVLKKYHINKSKIGFFKFWQKNVVPLLTEELKSQELI